MLREYLPFWDRLTEGNGGMRGRCGASLPGEMVRRGRRQ